jgi:cytochrome P450
MTKTDAATGRLPWDAADPYPFYESRRAGGDVVWDDTAQAWLVLGYDAARQVLGGAEWTSDPAANAITRASMDAVSREFISGSMLFADGAVHERLRGSVRDVFTRSAVADLTAGVESIAATLIDGPAPGTVFDFMADIALPLPIAVVGAWLDLDASGCQLLREQSPAIIRMLGTLADFDEIADGAAASATLMTEFLPLAADRRAHPGDDLLSFIAADEQLSLDEVVMTTILIAVAGHETTANLLGGGMVRLLAQGPDTVPVDITSLITELIRIDGPVQSTVRTATADQIVGDAEIQAGQSALIAIAAANRDPAVFDDPAQFRLDRSGPAPLSFGYGAHYCVGAALARLELSTVLPKILARQPVLAGQVCWRDTPAIRGPLSLPVMFGA